MLKHLSLLPSIVYGSTELSVESWYKAYNGYWLNAQTTIDFNELSTFYHPPFYYVGTEDSSTVIQPGRIVDYLINTKEHLISLGWKRSELQDLTVEPINSRAVEIHTTWVFYKADNESLFDCDEVTFSYVAIKVDRSWQFISEFETSC